jgi:hypothetical protein
MVLVKPKRADNLANPFLTFDDSLNTTAVIVVQALNAPETAMELGYASGQDTFTVKNWGDASVRDYGIQRPFITVSAQSSNPTRSVTIVSAVMDRARQELTNIQGSMRVPTRNTIKVESVVLPTYAGPVREAQMRVVLAAFLLGMVITTLAAWTYHVLISRVVSRRAPLVLADINRTVEWTPEASLAMRQTNGPVW